MKWLTLIINIIVCALFATVLFWVFFFRPSPVKTVNVFAFEGCYGEVSRGIRLKDGTLYQLNKPVTKYTFIPPIGGKHGYLLSVSNINVTKVLGDVIVSQGHDEFYWPIDENRIRVLASPNIDKYFTRRNCK